jgi:predicted choloylglycine hydrolase
MILILTAAAFLFSWVSCSSGGQRTEDSVIIKRHGNGFLEQKASGLKVMHLKGNAYERGYQRGMLQDDLGTVTLDNITELAAWFGDGDLETGINTLRKAKKTMEPFIPYSFKQEMKGMADALAARGSPVTYDDIVLHMVGADFGMMNPAHDLEQPPKRNPFPPLSRCSSFSVWAGAARDGKLIMAGNSDYYDTAGELENRAVAVVDPSDGGYGYTGALWDVFFTASGINEAGIAVNGHLVGADSESLRGVSSELLLGMILQYADSIEDAVEILTVYPRTCGIVVHIADAKTNRAAIIEYTADDIAVRFAEPGKEFLWTTNHFNCVPGWQGYSGVNMAPAYDQRAKLEDIGTVEKWQDSLAKVNKGRTGRYERYRRLLEKNHGNITVDKAKEIISDRYSLKQGKVLGPEEATDWNDYPIMVRQHDWVMSKTIQYYKRGKRGELKVKSGNVSSFVAVPSTGDTWWAVGIPPAAYTSGYTRINLHEELAKNRRK